MTSWPTGSTADPRTPADLRDVLVEGRQRIRTLHEQGRAAREIAGRLTGLCDDLVCRVYARALNAHPAVDRLRMAARISLVAVGGSGRGDMAPHSDVDLLVLLEPGSDQATRDLVSTLVRDLWDAGLHLGHAVREVDQCLAAARDDLTVLTNLLETRLLAGGRERHDELIRRVEQAVSAEDPAHLADQLLALRAREYSDYHAPTVLLLEPNVKKSPGGLRDAHLLRWLALARYGVAEPVQLAAAGALRRAETDAVLATSEFLLGLRHDLHYQAGGAQDVLTRSEQLRLAARLGYADQPPLLGVERFMQQYYQHTTRLHEVVLNFIDRLRRPALRRRILDRLAARRIEGRFLLSGGKLRLAPHSRPAVLGDAAAVVHMFDVAREYGVTLAPETLERVSAAAGRLEPTVEARRRLLEVLTNPAGLPTVVRDLHRTGVLGRLLPPFEQVRGLIQFNVYHHYTIDEHTLRALEALCGLADDQGPLGRAYRGTRRKGLLHLAMLLHDLGKGREGDHCDTGRELAVAAAADFALDADQLALLEFLVHKHLLMAHTALRRDPSDEQTLLQFTRIVGTPERLRMLYALTAADTMSVSPGNWTPWKASLLGELYSRSLEQLTEPSEDDEPERATARRRSLIRELGASFPADWLQRQLEQMPLSWLFRTPTAEAAEHLRAIREFIPAGARVLPRYLPETGLVEFTVLTADDLTPGIFSKIAGALAAEGIQIISADIATRPDGLVLDTFFGTDTTFSGPPPAGRLTELASLIEEVLTGRRSVEALLTRRRRAVSAAFAGEAPRVEIDNSTSDRNTIIEVFAEDRLGRLYAITQCLFDLGLSVRAARISTHLDQIVDVFYVTDAAGGQVIDPARLETIRARLRAAL